MNIFSNMISFCCNHPVGGVAILILIAICVYNMIYYSMNKIVASQELAIISGLSIAITLIISCCVFTSPVGAEATYDMGFYFAILFFIDVVYGVITYFVNRYH